MTRTIFRIGNPKLNLHLWVAIASLGVDQKYIEVAPKIYGPLDGIIFMTLRQLVNFCKWYSEFESRLFFGWSLMTWWMISENRFISTNIFCNFWWESGRPTRSCLWSIILIRLLAWVRNRKKSPLVRNRSGGMDRVFALGPSVASLILFFLLDSILYKFSFTLLH